MAHHLSAVTLAGLAPITALDLVGITESAKVLMGTGDGAQWGPVGAQFDRDHRAP
jgi:hypothetical protein